MTEIDALKYDLAQERKAFDKLHKQYIQLIDKQIGLEKENEQLKQFKDKTFDLLNKEIIGNEEAIEWGEKRGVDVGAIGFHTNMLKILRKELQEWLMS